MNCRKQYSWCSLRGKLAEVAVYSLVCSRFCRNTHSAADYCGNLLGSRGIGAGSSPIGCEGSCEGKQSSRQLSTTFKC